MGWIIVINQQVPSPDPDRVASEAKIKYSKRAKVACISLKYYMKKPKERISKDNQITLRILKLFSARSE